MLTVYLTNTELLAVSGSAIGKKYRMNQIWRQELPQDAIQNGDIADAALLKETISAFWKEQKLPKTANLVINGSRFVLKTIEAPQISGRKLRAFIAREYSDLDRSTQPVFTCFPLAEDMKKRQMQLLAAVGERPYLKKAIGVFESAGVRIGAADSSLGCSIRALRSLSSMKNRTGIVQLLESGSLTSILFVEGEYAYSTTNRVTAAPDTFEFGISVARIVSSILQFSKAQYADDTVTDVLLGGFSPESMEVCVESIAQMDSTLEVSALSGAGAVSGKAADSFHAMVPVVGGLSMPQRIELLKELRNGAEKNKNRWENIKMVLPAAVALVVLGGVSGVLLTRHARLKARLNDVQSFLLNPQYVAAGEEYEEKKKGVEELEKLMESADTTIQRIESYPLPTSEVAGVIYRCAEGLAGVTITGYDSKTGILSVSTSSEDVAVVNQYIELLRQEAVFSDVDYTGYNYNENTGRWVVKVVCTLAADAGREKEAEL